MLGQIVRMNGKQYVIVDMKSNEDMGSCSYDRTYKLVKYDEQVDVMEVELNHVLYDIEVRGVTKLPFTVCNDKLHYELVGKSNIKGKKVLYFERDFDKIETPKVPTR